MVTALGSCVKWPLSMNVNLRRSYIGSGLKEGVCNKATRVSTLHLTKVGRPSGHQGPESEKFLGMIRQDATLNFMFSVGNTIYEQQC